MLMFQRMIRIISEIYADIFSKSSEDIGHTPLVTMDIDTGDSPTCLSETL